MKKIALTLITLMLTVSATAVVGGPEPGENQMAITSADSPSYSSDFNVINVTQSNETGVTNHTWTDNTVNFQGVYAAPTPCHELGYEVEKNGNTFNFDVTSTQAENTTCAQVVTFKEYEASFTADQAYKLNVTHDGEQEDVFEHPKLGKETENGFFRMLLEALVALFQ